MSMKTVIKLPMLALAAALTLSACGSNTEQRDMLKSITGFGKNRAASAPQQIDVAAVVRNTKGPLTKVVQKDLNNITVFLVQIEQNGAYRTFGTAAKQTITFRQGMVTATRGLGDDLMSVSASGSLALIAARKSGTAQRVMHHLDGANTTLAPVYDCTIAVTGASRTANGTVSATTTDMTEHCRATGHEFTNSYKVDRAGYILASRQWISSTIGYFDITVLRR